MPGLLRRAALSDCDWEGGVIVFKGFWSYTAFIYHAKLLLKEENRNR